ncbi:MAG: response regulator [Fuerstiella sp.]|nr:response regulator [Fuerstiella sp.]MCP4855839.1 response regulator [Fuerstiella sp.]
MTREDLIEKSELDIVLNPMSRAAPLTYAHSEGCFERNGLHVNVRRAPGGSGVKELLIVASCDAAHMGLERVQHLPGVTFGIPSRFAEQYDILCHFLTEHGLDRLKDVTIREVPLRQMPYLDKGCGDGVFAPQPFGQVSVHGGTGVMFIFSKDICLGHSRCGFTTLDRFAGDPSGTHCTFLRSVLQARHKLHQSRLAMRWEGARDISAHSYPRQDDSTVVEQGLIGDLSNVRGKHFVQPGRMDYVPDSRPEFGDRILTQAHEWAQLAGKGDSTDGPGSTIDGEDRELSGLPGFASAPPTPQSSVEHSLPDTAPASDQSQALSAPQVQAEPLAEHQLSERTEKRLKEIIAQLARVAGGHYDANIDVTSTGEMGHLERILQETIVNLKFSRDALAEQVEHLDELVHERTKNLTDEIATRKTVEENLKHARAKAEVATRAKSEFLATMSHEIRTPLTAILGYTDGLHLFGDISKAPGRRIEMLSAIKRNGSHLLDLISDVLDLSQIEAGQLDLMQTPSSPHALVMEVCANLLGKANSKGLNLGVTCATPIPDQIPMDPKRFRQVMTNLIVNAIKFTSKGHVTVRLTAQESDSDTAFLEIAVEDSGIGISMEKQDQIFEPFTHGHDQNVCHKTGTGLGLSICRRLVTASGGEIRLTSDEGRGSVFSFTVPFPGSLSMWQPGSADLTVRQAAEIEWQVPDTGLSDIRILIVEDTPDTRDLLIFFLEEAGANVTAAADGADGVAKALESMAADLAYDLILMDMRMPEMDGYAATRRLRSEGFACPIVALTAFAMKHDEQACLDAGCDAYLSKPIDLCSLFETIGRQLPRFRASVLPVSAARPNSLVSDRTTDSRFQLLLEKYLKRLPGMLDQLQTARRDDDADSLLSVVHRLREQRRIMAFLRSPQSRTNARRRFVPTILLAHTSQSHWNSFRASWTRPSKPTTIWTN